MCCRIKGRLLRPARRVPTRVPRPAGLHRADRQAVRRGRGAQDVLHPGKEVFELERPDDEQAGGPGGLEDQQPRTGSRAGRPTRSRCSTCSTSSRSCGPTKVASDKRDRRGAQPAGSKPGRAADEGDGDGQGAGRTRVPLRRRRGDQEGDGLSQADGPGNGVRGGPAACSTSSRRRTFRTRSSIGSTRRR